MFTPLDVLRTVDEKVFDAIFWVCTKMSLFDFGTAPLWTKEDEEELL